MQLRDTLVAACIAFAAMSSAAEAASGICPVVAMQPVVLPHAQAAENANAEVLIVALGSSSTQSWMSSDSAHSYPAVLQRKLTELLPKAHVAVVNRGVGGEDAAEEVARIDSDVIALRPSVVIWQVGANGALRNVDPVVFKRLVTAGVARMQKANIDVVLMDNQRSPRIDAAPAHLFIDQATAEVAIATGASLVQRGALMDRWRDAGLGEEQFTSPDGLHHNDRGYGCLGEAVARVIAAGIVGERTTVVDAATAGERTAPTR